MKVRVVLFAILRERAGTASLELELDHGATVGQAVERLLSNYPNVLNAVSPIRLAVNREFAQSQAVLNEGDELALIPPVSGG